MLGGKRAFLDFVKKASPRKVSVLLHEGADPDAVCSGFAVCQLISEISGAVATLIAPGVSSTAKNVISALGIRVSGPDPDLGGCDLVVVVDTSSLSMLGCAAERLLASKVPVVQIDHHSPSPSMEGIASFRLLDEGSPSTTEIVYSLFKASKTRISKNLAQAFVFGIVSESGNLSRLRNSSLRVLCELSKAGGDVEAALGGLRKEASLDERIARLKSAQRVVLRRVGDILIAVSHVGSYHSSAAKSLIALGADLAATLAKNKDGLKISVRASENYASITGIHVGKDICAPLGALLGGEGSGHRMVGGIRANCGFSRARTALLSFLEEKSAGALGSSGGP
ncbi:MAG: DHH family phosphoesterase [Candidatus Brockarchaeota archaeon]|nr:DHH family phosphoesterase [Candidatus Brockarchaeota archaeon]